MFWLSVSFSSAAKIVLHHTVGLKYKQSHASTLLYMTHCCFAVGTNTLRFPQCPSHTGSGHVSTVRLDFTCREALEKYFGTLMKWRPAQSVICLTCFRWRSGWSVQANHPWKYFVRRKKILFGKMINARGVWGRVRLRHFEWINFNQKDQMCAFSAVINWHIAFCNPPYGCRRDWK